MFIFLGGLGGNFSVVCGSNYLVEIILMEIFIIIVLFIIWLISIIFELLLVEIIIIFVINENILDVIGLIVVILLEENKCDFLIGRFFFEYMIFKN